MDGGALAIYMRSWHPPDPHLKEVPGKWRTEPKWPPQGVSDTTLYLYDAHVLSTEPAKPGENELRYVPSIGVEAGFWWGELLPDQRPGRRLQPHHTIRRRSMKNSRLWGGRTPFLRASSTAPLADWFARLSDVAPDGTVTQVTGAGLSGAQRDSASDPKDLEPNKTYSLDIEMHLTTWTFPKGHRIRLAVSNALWPMAWPTPYAMTTTLKLGTSDGSRLVLPLVPPSRYAAPEFSAARAHGRTQGHAIGRFPVARRMEDRARRVSREEQVSWNGKSEETYPWGKETDLEALTYEADDNHPEISSAHGEAEIAMALKDRTLTWRGHLTLTSDAKNFYYKYVRELLQDGKVVKEKTWEETVPRDHQ